MRKTFAIALLAGLLGFGGMTVEHASAGDWQGILAWCVDNTGAPDCEGLYHTLGADDCLALGIGGGTGAGNRQCLIHKARLMASQGHCQVAFQLARACQCHNGNALREVDGAGVSAVCKWLGGPG
jgi:hypothetical protein